MSIKGIKASLGVLSLAALFTVGATGVSAHAHQQPHQGHFYIGSDLGVSNVDNVEVEDEIAAGIFGGYQFNRHFRLEVGVRSLASDEYSYGDRYEWSDEEFSLSSLQVSGVALVPVSQQVSLYGRLGMARVEAEIKYIDYDGGRRGSRYISTETTKENLGLVGVGVDVNVWNSLNVFAEYVQYEDFRDVGISTVTAGVTWHF